MLKSSFLATSFCVLAAVSSFTYADDQQKMMQDMVSNAMQGMMQAQHCLTESTNPQFLEEISKNSDKINNELERLCQAGQRQEAQNTAMAYSKKLLNDPEFQAMQKCFAQIDSDLLGSTDMQEAFNLEALSKTNICDEIESSSDETEY